MRRQWPLFSSSNERRPHSSPHSSSCDSSCAVSSLHFTMVASSSSSSSPTSSDSPYLSDLVNYLSYLAHKGVKTLPSVDDVHKALPSLNDVIKRARSLSNASRAEQVRTVLMDTSTPSLSSSCPYLLIYEWFPLMSTNLFTTGNFS